MKKFMFMFILVFTLLLSSNVFAEDNIVFKDVPESYWGRESIEYISSNRYMVGYGNGEFGVNDTLTQGQYLAVLCRIFGYDMLDPKDVKEPSLELGLLLKGENIDIFASIPRGDMAKYTIRAFEKLNPDVKYPDYIEAFSPMIADYSDLAGDIKNVALKCIEKGLIKGMPDGAFRPSYFLTRAEAATVIHRLLQENEREKARPIFAEPDLEFEAFMATEEAEEYCSVEFIDKVVDGKVIFKDYNGQNTGQLLAPNYNNEEVNKQIYELLRDYVKIAKDSGRYVRTFYSSIGGATFISFYEDSLYGKGPNSHIMSNIEFVFNSKPYKYFFDKQNEKTYYTIKVGNLAIQDTDWASYNYREPEMTETLKTGLKVVYGEDLGQRMFDFAIEEYDKEKDLVFNHNNILHERFFIEYREDLDGLEICYDNGLICTNK